MATLKPRYYWLEIVFTYWGTSRVLRAMGVMISSCLRLFHSSYSARFSINDHGADNKSHKRLSSIDKFTLEAKTSLQPPLQAEKLLDMSGRLVQEYADKLRGSDISMLPSYVHTLPTGNESGDFIALDVGGSTFRIAWISLNGKNDGTEDSLEIRSIRSFPIDNKIRALSGMKFFDWMAARIQEIVTEYDRTSGTSNAYLDMGLAWSFPIQQTSPRTGKLLSMGKGFRATCGVEGEDLGKLIMKACANRGLNVRIQAIVNDGEATLLSQAYRDPATRMSLIIGTGTNAAVFLPVSSFQKSKFGQRADSWHAVAERVIVNTEMSMVGKNILPTTKWDEQLNASHISPNFQPLEYLTTGRYLGEIVRLILVDAIQTAGLFAGCMPERLDEPYALDTRVLASFETDKSPALTVASRNFLKSHPLRIVPQQSELEFVRDVSALVSRRAAIYLATALYALRSLQVSHEGLKLSDASQVTIACTGTIIEKYPGFRARCQYQLDELCAMAGGSAGTIVLEMACESTLLGAAVAACIISDGN